MTKDQKDQLERHIRQRIESVNAAIAAFEACAKPVSPDNATIPDLLPDQQLPSDTRAMPNKIPGVWGLAPTSKKNCSRSESFCSLSRQRER